MCHFIMIMGGTPPPHSHHTVLSRVTLSYMSLYGKVLLLVFRRKDLCEAKHDVVCLKFCSKLDDLVGGIVLGDLRVNCLYDLPPPQIVQ